MDSKSKVGHVQCETVSFILRNLQDNILCIKPHCAIYLHHSQRLMMIDAKSALSRSIRKALAPRLVNFTVIFSTHCCCAVMVMALTLIKGELVWGSVTFTKSRSNGIRGHLRSKFGVAVTVVWTRSAGSVHVLDRTKSTYSWSIRCTLTKRLASFTLIILTACNRAVSFTLTFIKRKLVWSTIAVAHGRPHRQCIGRSLSPECSMTVTVTCARSAGIVYILNWANITYSWSIRCSLTIRLVTFTTIVLATGNGTGSVCFSLAFIEGV